jgi:hypothetical protein
MAKNLAIGLSILKKNMQQTPTTTRNTTRTNTYVNNTTNKDQQKYNYTNNTSNNDIDNDDLDSEYTQDSDYEYTLDTILYKHNLSDYKFKNTYNVWFHDANDNNFELDTFEHITSIITISDYIILNEVLKNNYKMLLNGMFFVMKNNINPLWTDDYNKNGGCISWKIDKHNSLEYWSNFFLLFITDNLPQELNDYNITGISINPKKNCNIFKLWVGKDINAYVINNIDLTSKCLFNNSLKLYKSFKNFV